MYSSSRSVAAPVSAVSRLTERGHFERNFMTGPGRPKPVPQNIVSFVSFSL